MEKFEENNPEGPNIRLRPVDVVEVAFRGHVEGRPNICIFERFPKFISSILGMYCETEISNLSLAPFNKNIGRFDIPMHNVFGVKVPESLKDIFDERIDLVLSESSFKIEFFLQSSFRAQFSDEIAMVDTFQYLVATDGIIMVQLS